MAEGLTAPRRGEQPRGVRNWIFRGAATNTDEQSDGKVGQTGTKWELQQSARREGLA